MKMPKPSRWDLEDLDNLVARHRGIVCARDLVKLGLSKGTISYRTRERGPWKKLLPGVIQAFTGSASLVQRAIGALSFTGGGAMITGLAALRLYGVRDLPASWDVDVLVPHRQVRKSKGYVRVERTRRLPQHRSVQGIAVAPKPRAVLDAVRGMDKLDSVRSVVASAVQGGHCTVDELVVELRSAHTKCTRLARLALDEVIAGIRSVAEAKARVIFERSGVPPPRWNHDVFDVHGTWLSRPDCIWPELGVVLEIDSMAWHLSPASYRTTQARQRRMTRYGLLVIPVSPTDLLENPQSVVREILETLANAKCRPAPIVSVRPAS